MPSVWSAVTPVSTACGVAALVASTSVITLSVLPLSAPAVVGANPSAVIAGLDPAIHPTERNVFSMDARVISASTRVFRRAMPGHDESKTTAAVLPRHEPPHARHLAADGADARDRLRDRLERDRHVKGIGVNERCRIAYDGDVPLPEHEIAPPQLGGRDRELSAERLFLHGAVARAGNAARAERDLQQARTVEAERRLAAPQIGRAQEAL